MEDIKRQVSEALRARDEVRKDVLRVALGEIQTAEARKGSPLAEDEAQKQVRKLIKSNEETLAVVSDPAVKAKLGRENEVLEALLPKALSADEIAAALAPAAEAIRGAKADGPAIGIAMKHLKTTGAVVDGKDVNEAVRRIRGG